MNIIDKILKLLWVLLISLLILFAGFNLGITVGTTKMGCFNKTDSDLVQDAFIQGKMSTCNYVDTAQIINAIQFGLSQCNMSINNSDIKVINN